jgi:hypothetical protein
VVQFLSGPVLEWSSGTRQDSFAWPELPPRLGVGVPPSCRRLPRCGCHPLVVDVDACGCGTDRRSPRFSPCPVDTTRVGAIGVAALVPLTRVRWTLVRTGVERAPAHQSRPRSPRFAGPAQAHPLWLLVCAGVHAPAHEGRPCSPRFAGPVSTTRENQFSGAVDSRRPPPPVVVLGASRRPANRAGTRSTVFGFTRPATSREAPAVAPGACRPCSAGVGRYSRRMLPTARETHSNNTACS